MKRRLLPDSAAAVTGERLRHVLASYPTGVGLLAADTEEGPAGLLLNSFTSLSLDPPLVMAAIARTSTSWPALRRAPRLGLSVLAEHHGELRAALSRPAPRRFEGVELRQDEAGALLLPDAAAGLRLALDAEHPGGDHTIAVLAVVAAERADDLPPLVFHGSRYRRLAE